MKIAIPVDHPSLESKVAENFGRAANFVFYDDATKEAVYVDNSAIMSQGGAGIKAAQVIVDHGAQVLITPRCGENAAEVLKKAGVALYGSVAGSAEDNVRAFEAQELTALTDIHAGFHHQG
ncbi:MAG: NifB/NifX family molybdenum-iron cluster-binding protein [Peptococcaceae bacterium]|nr:NifB/NifX family molybdenum-iron cluster-binding protein [Peptococcaceae bacterium]